MLFAIRRFFARLFGGIVAAVTLNFIPVNRSGKPAALDQDRRDDDTGSVER